jgi:hypothetical protein
MRKFHPAYRDDLALFGHFDKHVEHLTHAHFKKNHPSKRASPLASVYMEKKSSRLARSRLFQARSRQAGQPVSPYKRTEYFTINSTTLRYLAYRAVPLSGPARLPYKQALKRA